MRASRPHVLGIIVAAITLVDGAVGGAQQAGQAPQRAPGVAKSGVTAVLVDVIVRDRRGQPVRDLTQADFEVTEDGVPQPVGSFTAVFDGAVAIPATPAPPAPASPAPAAARPPAAGGGGALAVPGGPAITALVFDRLSQEARSLAVQAALKYLGDKPEAANYIGVFSIDLSMAPYSPFTRDTRVLRRALEQMGTRASTSFAQETERRRDADRDAAAATQSLAQAVAGAEGGSPAVAGTASAAQFAMMQSRMIQEFDVLERDQQGYATTNGLFAIINTLRQLPGRKSVVLFSEGIAIPPAVQRLFLGVIAAANRANVSIYAMDAAGLRAESEQAKIRDQVNQAAKRGINTGYANVSGSEPLTKDLEKNEDVLRQDPNTGLGSLARDTGGLLFDNTNNLRQGFDRVESDLRNYYLLGYTPANTEFDGRFRNIDVRVNRPGLVVSARKGYFAVRDAGGAPINSWEAPALGALEQKPVPNAFPMRAAALLFPESQRPGLVAVVAQVRTAPLTFAPAEDGKTYTSDFAVLTRFLDQQNEVVRKVSQHYEVKGPIADIERAKQGEVIFYREPELKPGVYTMETIVYDAPTGKSSVRLATVEVPAVDPARLRMSTLMLVRRGDKVPPEDRRPDNPLLVDDLLLYPNLGEATSKASKEVAFYFTVYPAASGTPEAVLDLIQNGAVLAQVPLPLAGPDATGRIQQTARLPLDALAPGTYELRVIVKQGSQQVFRSTMMRLQE